MNPRYLLLALYFLSGATALAYEVLWVRMLSLQFGVSIFGVVVTVATFMLGLGLGSLFAVRLWSQIQKPLRRIALLEGVITLFALLSPFILRFSESSLTALAADVSLNGWFVLQSAFLFVVLLVPALLMGAAFPLVVRSACAFGIGLSTIYGINILGGVLGALLPLVLLPALGWLSAMQIVALLGLLVTSSALYISHLSKDHLPFAVEHAAEQISSTGSRMDFYLYGLVGAAALALEIAWTRLFGMVMLRTEYVLAVILAVFLLGMALGSLLVRRFAVDKLMPWFPLLLAISGLASLWLLPGFSGALQENHFPSLGQAMFWQGSALGVLTLPMTLVLGAWLPLLSQRLGGTGVTGAQLYGYNSLGSALGAVMAGFLLIPLLGSTAVVVLATLVLVLLAIYWSSERRSTYLLPLFLLLAMPVWKFPPVAKLLPGSHGDTQVLSLYEDAVSLTHVLQRADGQRLLLSDLRRMDAATDADSVAVQMNQARLPLLLHGQAREVLFLGLGTGISAAGSLAFPDLHRTAVELSQGAIEAIQPWFAPVNGGVAAHLNIVRDDARHFLISDMAFYDVIIGDLFHPDLVGRAGLLSVQQFQRAHRRLKPGGLFVQWLALNQFDPAGLATVLRSFRQVFPGAILYIDAFRLALVGGKDELPPIRRLLATYADLPQQQLLAMTGGEGLWSWLGRFWGEMPQTEGPVQDEWAPTLEFHLPGARYRGELDLARLLHDLLASRPRVEQAAEFLQVPLDQREYFTRAYAATELAERSWLALLRGQQEESRKLMRLAYQANPQDRWVMAAMADNIMATVELAARQGIDEGQVLQAVLKIRPDHPEALRRQLELARLRADKQLEKTVRERLRVVSPLDSSLDEKE